MNAIIALCHFCEVHGPAVLFCTQAFHSNNPKFEDHAELDSSNEADTDKQNLKFSAGDNSWVNQESSAMGVEAATVTATAVKPKPSDLCEACRSLPSDLPGYMSRDPEANVSYVSSQYPMNRGVYSIVRQACLRSISSEVCPGREGPIYFGDDGRGQVLSHTFVACDENARGLHRLYSIIVIMMDKIFLLSSWPFLVNQLQRIIEQIKTKIGDPALTKDTLTASCQRPSMLRRHLKVSRKASRLRSFVDITGDPDIFEKLHQAFASILKAGGNRLTERLLEGPPTEDSVIDLDRQEDTDEGFVKLYRRAVVNAIPSDATTLSDDENYEEENPEADFHQPVHVFTGLRNLLKVLGYSRFHILAHHVVRGSHLVVRAQHRELVRSVIDALKMLLPKGCCQAVYFTKKLEDWSRCNFVGMPLHILLPDHPPGVDLILEISEPRLDWFDPLSSVHSRLTESMIERSIDQVAELTSRHYHIYSPTDVPLPSIAPTVLQKLESALMNEQLADSVVEQCIICLKEEWMSKVKVMYKFTKVGGSRSKEDTHKLLQIVGAKEEDKVILEFWMKGLSDKYLSIQS